MMVMFNVRPLIQRWTGIKKNFTLKSHGTNYLMMSRYKKSLADLNKSLEIESNDATLLNNCCYMMDRLEESLADLTKSLEIKPNDALLLRIQGAIYYMIGKYEESLANLTKSLKIDPKDTWA